jgi:hypothetical protein
MMRPRDRASILILGIIALIVFFASGILVLTQVDEEAGMRVARL